MSNLKENNPDCTTCVAHGHSFFNILDKEGLSELALHKTCVTYKRGQFIFNENGFPHALYCLNRGKVKLCTIGVDGKEQILRLVKTGDILGYRALISNERYHCSAVAIEDSSICVVDRNYFLEATRKHPQLLFEVVRIISRDLKTAEEHIVSLSQRNVRERMAEALLFFKATFGFLPDGQTLNVTFSREEIADYVGTSTESAIRLLSEFNQDKIIELDGKKIKITNLPKLLKTANTND
ncbi:MAG: Crp/Fnr family transcriptional regulator [Chitinophagales bacterium]|nr:Crp/Fnr family transcriptional regulator [Chitinophagales bacterium]MCO5281031.1 Crp/Fnr family transcriptional regulator [Chitinophagales bacterium]HRN93864.1 Crp/Fnr family transcriptional regulator [Chitinophagales bacterium]HRP38531.1 Crp/Fnr family transcriptional regulator [Chitinophagales bacterium]